MSRGARAGAAGPLASVNTWLIIINVAVFVVGHVFLRNHFVTVPAGQAYYEGVTAEQIAKGQPRLDRPRAVRPGEYQIPIFDTSPVFEGKPPVEIGFARYRQEPVLNAYGHFSTGKFWNEGQVWRLITFQFLHFDHWHLLFNMLGLYFVGGLVERYLGRRRYAVFYLACGVCGALAYLVLNLLGYLALSAGLTTLGRGIPFLLFADVYTPLIGASAGVFGVLLAAAYIAPSELVAVMGIIPMKLRTAVYIFLGLAILNLFRGGQNAGGDAAHVGGALAGAWLIRRPHILRDFVTGFGYLGNDGGSGPRRRGSSLEDARDRILEKARTQGTQSLSAADRATLRRALDAERGGGTA